MKFTAVTVIVIAAFVAGLYFCATQTHKKATEGFGDGVACPNLLIQKGAKLHLLNTRKARIPGVNPIVFNNLEDYVEFLHWQRRKGIKCPILYFRQSYTTQGEKGYRMLPDPLEPQAGLPSMREARETPLYDASRDDMPYNKNNYPGFDPQDQNIGAYTPLDKLFHSSDRKSADPMDANWAGAQYAEQLVTKGFYSPDTRYAYDNPFKKGTEKRGIYKKSLVLGPAPAASPKVTAGQMAPGTEAYIKAAYGGEVGNAPEERLLLHQEVNPYPDPGAAAQIKAAMGGSLNLPLQQAVSEASSHFSPTAN